jgi:hypothetical protein
MRRNPVTRSEIRFNGHCISTLPVDAVRKEEFGRIVPLLELWAPLLCSLTRWRRRDNAWAQFFTAIGPPRNLQRPEPVHLPNRYMWPEPRLCSCQRCGGEFYCVGGRGRYCSDVCAEASWRASRAARNTAMAKSRSEARAATRADRHCARCNEPILSQRSTRKFCSVSCRVAAHRERKAEKFSAAVAPAETPIPWRSGRKRRRRLVSHLDART